MIAIVNVGEIEDKRGVYEYEVRINTIVLTRFDHARKDGLAVCLRLASEAVVGKTRGLEVSWMKSKNLRWKS